MHEASNNTIELRFDKNYKNDLISLNQNAESMKQEHCELESGDIDDSVEEEVDDGLDKTDNSE